MNNMFFVYRSKIFAKKFVDSEIIRILGPTESATLPVEQRTRAGPFFTTILFPVSPCLFVKLFIFGVQSQIHPKRVFIGFLYLIGRKATSFVKSNGAVFFGCKCFNRKELTTS